MHVELRGNPPRAPPGGADALRHIVHIEVGVGDSHCNHSMGASLKIVVLVECSDGQEFPVRRRLLRPCIALTKLVQVGGRKWW